MKTFILSAALLYASIFAMNEFKNNIDNNIAPVVSERMAMIDELTK